ncbi:Cro/CI family transcriptional regulator [Stenotrophomonas sp. 278]|uniref:Cro/CI family transcriptional regulator n=1 Tax=Stenotrophomonas sp. 278 TaxID=2479851 RepID=UPI00163A800E|nr:Cro/CI family transcriptional regulator [Stenotrophomonas sp. 278]
MTQTISKKQAVEAYGSVGGLADALGITRSAIYQWPEGPIADVHALRILFVLRPPGLEKALEGGGKPCRS